MYQRNNSGGDPFRGEEVPPSIEEHIAAIEGWIATHPEDHKARQALQSILHALQDADKVAPLPDWTWDKAGDPQNRQWLIQDWLPASRVSLLAGRGGAGKSRFGLQIAAGVASGGGMPDAWIDAPESIIRLGNAVSGTGGAVVYVTWEDEEDEIDRRLTEISGEGAPWVTREQLKNLHVVNLARRGPLWSPLEGRHVSTLAELTVTGRLVREKVEKYEAVLLVVDPLAAAYAGDENARGLVRAFVADWDGWCLDIGCAVLLIAHPPKTGAAYSGSTDWEGAVRSMMVMKEERIGDPPRGNRPDNRPTAWQLSLPKRNYARPQPPLRMIWDNTDGGLRWRLNWWEEAEPPGQAAKGGQIDLIS